MRDAIHAGPVLIDQEKINITVEDEVFFNTPISVFSRGLQSDLLMKMN